MLHLVIGGASIEVSVHDDSWLGAIVGLSGAPTGRSAGRIECGGAVTAPPDALPDFADGDARGWTERPVPHLVMGAAHVSLGEGVVAITAPPDRGLEAFDRALPLTLTWLLGAVDLWVLHAAAVIGSDGLALVATSPGGGGKSTVALAASAGGWPVLADDLVVVRLRPGPAGGGPGSLEVCGVPRPLAVPSEFSDFGPPIPGDVRCRRRVSAPLQGGWWPVGRMAVLAHGTEPATTAEPLRAIDAFLAIRTAHFAADVPARMPGWFPVAGQLARLPVRRIALGSDPDTRLQTTFQVLGQAAALTATGIPPTLR